MTDQTPSIDQAITAMRRYAMWYLSRYGSASVRQFRQKLHAKLTRLEFDGDGEPIINTIVDDMIAEGLINDADVARFRTTKLVNRGWSPAKIRDDLKQRGIETATVDATLNDSERLALEAAIHLARRRRIGPWRNNDAVSNGPLDGEQIDREMRIMAARGFNYALAKQIIGAATIDELMEKLNGFNTQ